MYPPSEQIAGGPHGGGLDRRLGPHPTAAQDGHVLGVTLVVFGLTAMAGLPVEGMAEDEREAEEGASISINPLERTCHIAARR
jgi:hypothetical protein